MPKQILLQIFTFLLFLSLIPTISKIHAVGNLAPNPSFENGINKPDNWTPIKDASCKETTPSYSVTFEQDNNQHRTGTKSLSIKNVLWQSYDQPSISWVSDPINLEIKDQDYETS